MVRELSHYIDGQHVEGTSGRFSDVYDPCTGEVQARVPLASTEEVRNVIANAEKGQLEWAAMNPQRRGRVLKVEPCGLDTAAAVDPHRTVAVDQDIGHALVGDEVFERPEPEHLRGQRVPGRCTPPRPEADRVEGRHAADSLLVG